MVPGQEHIDSASSTQKLDINYRIMMCYSGVGGIQLLLFSAR